MTDSIEGLGHVQEEQSTGTPSINLLIESIEEFNITGTRGHAPPDA